MCLIVSYFSGRTCNDGGDLMVKNAKANKPTQSAAKAPRTIAKTKPPARQRQPKAQVVPDDMLAYYREMLLIRRFEEKAGQLYGMGLIGGFCHLYIGQEAVVVGA